MSSHFLGGVPGSGKTHFAVKEYFLKTLFTTDRPIYHNIRGINVDNIIDYYYNHYFVKPSFLPNFLFKLNKKFFCKKKLSDTSKYNDRIHYLDTKEEIYNVLNVCDKMPLLIIDEVQLIYGIRTSIEVNSFIIDGDEKSVTTLTSEFANKLSIHRQKLQDIVLITQDIDNIAAPVRRYIEYTHIFTKALELGDKNGFIFKSYKKDDIKKPPTAIKHEKYDKNIFRCYKSYNIDGVDDPAEFDIKPRSTAFYSSTEFKLKIFGLIFVLVAIAGAILFVQSYVSNQVADPVPIDDDSNDNSNITNIDNNTKLINSNIKFYTSIFLIDNVFYIYLLDGNIDLLPSAEFYDIIRKSPVFFRDVGNNKKIQYVKFTPTNSANK